MNTRLASASLVLIAFPAGAAAQSFNIDVGGGNGLPDPSYAGAAGQPGVWASLDPIQGGNVIPHLDGTPSNFFIATGGGNGFGHDDSALTSGDDEALMDDYWNTGTGFGQSFFYCLGLEAGTYEITTYSWSPTDPSVQTSIEISGNSLDPVAFSGGAWTGMHQEGVTYVLQTVNGAGFVIIATPSLGEGRINGFQFKKLENIGTNFCTSTPNSTGLAATIVGLGSTSVVANDLILRAGPVPALQPGIFFYGPNEIQTPFGNGFRCVGGAVQRLLPPTTPDIASNLIVAVDNTHPNHAAQLSLIGSVWKFQAWFRDPAGGGDGFDLSDGLSLTVTP